MKMAHSVFTQGGMEDIHAREWDDMRWSYKYGRLSKSALEDILSPGLILREQSTAG